MRPFPKHAALGILSLLLAPFLVGFDIADSSGTHLKISGGRGAYHVSSCRQSYDSELLEGSLALRATFPAPSAPESATTWSRLRPGKTSVRLEGSFVQERLTLVSHGESESTVPLGTKSRDNSVAGGLYLDLDWTWAGLKLGVAGVNSLPSTPGVSEGVVVPAAGLRLGPERLFASAEVLTGSPHVTGGGFARAGVGGRVGEGRLWGGLASGPYSVTHALLKGSHPVGPFVLHAAGMVGVEEPSSVSLDREYGASLGIEIPLPTGR